MNSQTNNDVKEQAKNSKNNKWALKKILKIALIIVQIIFIPSITIYFGCITNTLTNTANLLQLNDAIQTRTDQVYDIELKENEIRIAIRNGEIIDEAQAKRTIEEKRNAVTALLNTYEFACQHYLDRKIDKKAFKAFYEVMIKYIREKEEYDHFFIFIDGEEKFSAINEVYRKWHMK